MVGPDYERPDAPVPVAYKELPGWTMAQPQDAADRGAWWSVYHDPELDHLERQVDVSNQTVKQFEAEYRNAQALVQEAQASLFPVATLNGAVTHGSGFGGSKSSSSSSSSGSLSNGGGAAHTQYTVEGSISWDLDVWGRIRRQVESQQAAAQVSAADLANARLSAQATLATDYFDLRAEDSLTDLLRQTVVGVSPLAADHAEPVRRRHRLLRRRGDRAGAAGRRTRAACRGRRAARASSSTRSRC